MSKSHEGRIERIVPQHISYPEQLPVAARKDEIMRAIAEHQVVVVAGETGSGKTTQLPKMCLELGRGREKRIGHTQPRRIAARAVSSRIAEEPGLMLGFVGYQVRFNDQVSDQTAIKVMTDGILLTELTKDRQLKAYDTLIIDEAHERSLNIDFILGYLKRLLPKRPDLKVIITSATIDVERFSSTLTTRPLSRSLGAPIRLRFITSMRLKIVTAGFKGRCLNSSMRSRLKNTVRVATCSSFALASGKSEILPKRCASRPDSSASAVRAVKQRGAKPRLQSLRLGDAGRTRNQRR